MICSW